MSKGSREVVLVLQVVCCAPSWLGSKQTRLKPLPVCLRDLPYINKPLCVGSVFVVIHNGSRSAWGLLLSLSEIGRIGNRG